MKCVNCLWNGKEADLTKISEGAMHDGKCPVCGDEVMFDKNEKKEEKLDFDINNDGKVDAEDISLIAKKLGNMKKKISKKRR